jgi:hypothetical protein
MDQAHDERRAEREDRLCEMMARSEGECGAAPLVPQVCSGPEGMKGQFL